jgi:uncharacterized membrane protein
VFLTAAWCVVIVGYRATHIYPLAAPVVGVVLLAALGFWYASVRHADERTRRRTLQAVVLAQIVLVLVVPRLL